MSEGLFTKAQAEQIERDYQAMNTRLGRVPDLPQDMEPDETLCMKFLFAYMPVSDAASYPVSLYHKAVRDTLRARALLPWSDKVTGELFFNYVLPCRTNNEDLTDHRGLFFDELYQRVKDLDMYHAALEANYWCFEKATYQSTNTRTLSPLGVIKNAYGRCGEESAFLTAALRSVGIPSRQCYTPRWAHCDDNHAWVEFYDGESWRFTGACEPEPAADKGWFTAAAQRGMLIHARVFSSIITEPGVTHRTPVMSQVNILGNYAKTRCLAVRVAGDGGKPVAGAQVRFELINFAELFPIVTLYTDSEGAVRFDTGMGDLMIHVSHEGRFMSRKVDMRVHEGEALFDWSQAVGEETQDYELDLCPPKALPVREPDIPQEMRQAHERKNARCIELRKAYEDTFLKGEKAAAFASGFPAHQQEIAALISGANGNHAQIARFLKEEDLSLRVMLLQSLEKKDLSDLDADILEEHLRYAKPLRGSVDDALYAEYILCPRVHLEMITPYRAFISQFFTAQQADAFRADPARVFAYVQQNVMVAEELDYATISADPRGLLSLKTGSEMSKKILFTAICRTFGIPARVSPVDLEAEYYHEGAWHAPARKEEGPKDCRLTISSADGSTELCYRKNFSVALLENGVYTSLGLEKEAPAGTTLTYPLRAGAYRVIVANRMTDGSILASFHFVRLHPGEGKTVRVSLRERRETALATLPEASVYDAQGNALSMTDFAQGQRRMAAWLAPGGEPTEHLLNEILEQPHLFEKYTDRLLLVLRDEKEEADPTLRKVKDLLPIRTVYAGGSFEGQSDALAQAAGVDTGKYPLVLALDGQAKCAFALAGYNVGTGDMILRHLKAAPV